ncbi:unnamed protein product [Pseudo-nitzschia multistriata]|uniref:Serine/threonine-protein phosphatase n=1 Tax=Pseudo-nitzschia multistriata TaxID=183589 RepID=A0A448YZT4_9STRA|nr:unnamed protein product [Pseudo-nitzschia multistriata]
MADLDLDAIIKQLFALSSEKPGTVAELEEDAIISLCSAAKELFLSKPMVLRLNAPIKICGDLHGQYFDLLRLMDHSGRPPNTSYLFLGDYCDRGKQSIEVLCLLFALKLKDPERVHMIRGNHESRKLSRMYGFYDECKRRYNPELWEKFVEVFDCMPAVAIISDKIMCVHGGLSPELEDLEQINAIERPCDLPEQGLLCDLLWADPEPGIEGWDENDRGVSYVFGEDVVEEFVKKHDLDVIVRAHQVVEEGYDFFAGRKLITLFSAPNYTGEFDNSGAIMIVDSDMNCRFQMLKPSQKTDRPKKGQELTPLQRLRMRSNQVKNALTAVKAFGKPSSEDILKKMNEKRPCKEASSDYRSMNRKKSETKINEADFSNVRFTDNALILETENLTRRKTSWGDVFEDLYYTEEQIAEFRYEAFNSEMDDDEDDWFN